MDLRISAPSPTDRTSEMTPMMNANEIIKIGRKRSLQASRMAVKRSSPRSCSDFAN
jgi:hypothetical protein